MARAPKSATNSGSQSGAGWRWASLVVVPAAVSAVAATRGLRVEHVVVGVLFVVLAWVGPRSRRFSLLALPFVLVGLLYDYFGLALGLRGAIHVGDLHGAELAVFSAPNQSTWAEWFDAHNSSFVDVLTGLAYATYIFETFLVAVWLYFRDESRMAKLAWAFLLANLMGMVVWLAWPAAPPWYVMEHGLGPAVLDAPPSAAGAARFDELVGIGYFASFYERNINVFGAMPSLHTAYPTIVACAVFRLGTWWRVGSLSFAALVGFSAVYLSHHYVLDVLAGVTVGVAAWFLVVAVARALTWWRPAPSEAMA